MIKSSRSKGFGVDLLFTITLLCVFAVSCVTVVLIGADVYQRTVENMDENFTTRTALVYVWEKVKQQDQSDAVRIEPLGDTTALVLSQGSDVRFETWIYSYDGYLRELLIPAGKEFLPQDGTAILAAPGFSITQTQQGLVRLSLPGADGAPPLEMLIGLRSQ